MSAERDGRPVTPSPPSYRSAEVADLAAIADLEAATLAVWSDRSWADELAASDRDVLVATVDGTVVGVITVQTVAERADLNRLLVAPSQQRRGIGTELVRRGLAAARARGAASVLLEVAWDNDAAIALYAEAGFEQLGVRPHYYGPGRDALIMRRYELEDLDE